MIFHNITFSSEPIKSNSAFPSPKQYEIQSLFSWQFPLLREGNGSRILLRPNYQSCLSQLSIHSGCHQDSYCPSHLGDSNPAILPISCKIIFGKAKSPSVLGIASLCVTHEILLSRVPPQFRVGTSITLGFENFQLGSLPSLLSLPSLGNLT